MQRLQTGGKDSEVRDLKQGHKDRTRRGLLTEQKRTVRVVHHQVGRYESVEKEWRDIIDSETEPHSVDYSNLAAAFKR